MPSHKYQVFLSYSKSDESAVEEIAGRLKNDYRIQVWFDKWKMIGGDSLQDILEKGLDESAACAVFVGSDGAEGWARMEMQAAIRRHKKDPKGFRLIPVFLPGAPKRREAKIPMFLAGNIEVDFREGMPQDEDYQRLINGILGTKPDEGSPPRGAAVTLSLPSIERVSPLSGLQALVGIDHVYAKLPGVRLERKNTQDVQSVSGILKRLRRHTPIVILVGPQLSGKSWLTKALLEHLNADEKPVSVHHELVPAIAAANKLSRVDFSDFPAARFFMYALWAQRMLKRVLDDNFTAETQAVMEKDPEYASVFRYRDDLEVAQADIAKKFRDRPGVKGADFRALESSVIEKVRDAHVPKGDLFLLLEIEDFDKQGSLIGGKRDASVTALAQFWRAIRGYAEVRIGESAAARVGGSLRMLVTTRPPDSAVPRPDRKKNPVTLITGFSETECKEYAERAELQALFPDDELAQLVHYGHEDTGGYAWFIGRFLRGAAFLRSNGIAMPVRELSGMITSAAPFWYWEDPFSIDTWAEMSKATEEADVFPERGQVSRFVSGVWEVFDGEEDLLSWYRKILGGENETYSHTAAVNFLIPLLRVGLIRRRQNGQGYEPPNRIVELHFSPGQLRSLFNATYG